MNNGNTNSYCIMSLIIGAYWNIFVYMYFKNFKLIGESPSKVILYVVLLYCSLQIITTHNKSKF